MRKFLRAKGAAIGVGLGAGLAGAALLVLRHAFRPIPRLAIPDAISPAIFATRVAHTSLGEIVYHESGSGDPLVFLHGINIGASSYEWSRVYPQFAMSHRVIAADLLGFGESERSAVRLSAEEQARALAEFVEITCGRQRPVIVASNVSGGFAVLMASHHPDLARRLILIMPTGLTEFRRRRIPLWLVVASKLPALSRSLYRQTLASKSAVTAWLKREGFHNESKVTDEHIAVHYTCANQYGAEHAIYSLLTKRYHFDFAERLARLAVPVSLLWSDCCPASPLEWGYRLMGSAPRHSSLTVIRQTSLLAALEDPTQVRDAITSQLDSSLRMLQPG